jgi:hypothetical protein
MPDLAESDKLVLLTLGRRGGHTVAEVRASVALNALTRSGLARIETFGGERVVRLTPDGWHAFLALDVGIGLAPS